MSDDYLGVPMAMEVLRRAAVDLGVWETISQRPVLAGTDARGLVHGVRQSISRVPHVPTIPVSLVSLGALEGHLCPCFLAHYVQDHEFFWDVPFTKVGVSREDFDLVENCPLANSLTVLAGFTAALQEHTALLENTVSLDHFTALRGLTGLALLSWASPLEVEDLEVDFSAEERALLREKSALVKEQWLRPAVALLRDEKVTGPVLEDSRHRWVSQSYLVHLDLEEDMVLLGVFGESIAQRELNNRPSLPTPEALDARSAMVDFFVASCLWGGGEDGASFYRVPRFAYDFLARSWGDLQLRLQQVPFPGDLSWEELSVLWDPHAVSALCSLSRAVETLQLA